VSRGRGVVVLTCADGVLFVAENPSTALHKVSEIYDRIGFAAVGRYNEYENLRSAGVPHGRPAWVLVRAPRCDRPRARKRLLGHARRDLPGADQAVRGGAVRAEVAEAPADDELYR
jgi:proteasome alpha subunit